MGAAPFTGIVDGDRFIITSDVVEITGAAVRLADPRAMTWRNEMSANGGRWTLVEEYEMRPAEAEAGE